MKRLVGAALVLALAACHKPAPAPPPEPARPFTFAHASRDGEVSLTLPEAIAPYPVLHRALYDSGTRRLTEFLAQAGRDRARTIKRGAPDAPYSSRSVWRITAETPRLIGLAESWAVYSGGAHPNHGSTTMIWDKATEGEVQPAALLRPGADTARLGALLCERVRQAKVARLGPAALQGEFWSCPPWSSRAALAPSTLPGKAGGLTFLFDPYVIGAYAEGDYAVTVPQSAFHSELSELYKEQFAGSPLPPAKPARAQ